LLPRLEKDVRNRITIFYCLFSTNAMDLMHMHNLCESVGEETKKALLDQLTDPNDVEAYIQKIYK
jgi:hypothetical protein